MSGRTRATRFAERRPVTALAHAPRSPQHPDMALPESLEQANAVCGVLSFIATVAIAVLLWWYERAVRLRETAHNEEMRQREAAQDAELRRREAVHDAELRLRGLLERLASDDAMHVISAFKRECAKAHQHYFNVYREGHRGREQAFAFLPQGSLEKVSAARSRLQGICEPGGRQVFWCLRCARELWSRPLACRRSAPAGATEPHKHSHSCAQERTHARKNGHMHARNHPLPTPKGIPGAPTNTPAILSYYIISYPPA